MKNSLQLLLFSAQDLKYKEFFSKLVPNVKKEQIIGIRTPFLRATAKDMRKKGEYENFLRQLPHFYLEENNLHAFIIEGEKDFDNCIRLIKEFLPYVDNWSTCDQMSPKCFYKNEDKLIKEIKKWLDSKDIYTMRFAVKTLMSFYLDKHFDKEHLKLVSSILSEEYYLNMAIAWYFATALAKQWDYAITYVEEKRLPPFVLKKTIQKAVESKRITPEQKEYLKSLK